MKIIRRIFCAEPAEPPRDFPFPFTPYDIQVGFMQQLYRVLENSKIGIFESPTGTVRCKLKETINTWGLNEIAAMFLIAFLMQKKWFLSWMLMRFVPEGPIDHKAALVQLMAWGQTGDNHYLNCWWPSSSWLMHKIGLSLANALVPVLLIWFNFNPNTDK